MALTRNEIEAKLAALEERFQFLSQASESLEWRFEHGVERWTQWSEELREALGSIIRQLDRIRKQVPAPPEEPPPGKR